MAPPSKKKISKPALRKPLKDKTSNASMSLQLEDEVPDFPRGGGSCLSREELDEVRAEVDAEFKAEERLLKKRKKQKKMQTTSTQDDLGSLFGGGINGKLPRFANRITLKNISPGMKLWGVVCEVNEKDIVVSLPGGLRGLVRASEVVPSFLEDGTKVLEMDNNFLSSVYHVGQLVSCIVLHLDDDKKEAGKRKIWLSLRLSLLHKNLTLDVIQEGMILSAYVKSMEDHGYIIHFGLPSFSGFMPKESENVEVKIRSGQLVQGVVKSIDRTRRVVYLSSDPDVVSKCVTKDLKGISIDLLVPGMMVNASVRSILENGIMLSFLTYFTGTADMFNLLQTFPSSSWKVDYPQNKKVNARILFIDPSTRAVGLTLNPHLVHNKAPPALIKVGDIFDQSKVIRIDRGLGLLLEIPSSPVPTPAYVNVSDVADKEVKKLEKSFKEGKLVRVRVLGFRRLEGLATGVLKTSAFEGSVFTHSDVKPGMVVKAKVIAVDSFGAIVQFSSGVKALCPLRHMSEFEIVKPRKKFQVGAELIFRILGCKSKRITITHKKTLVKSKLEILGSYADAIEGLTTHGWITKIENHGCFVRFYNGVQGFAPRSELGLDPGCEISSMYHVEQVVKCRVTSSNPASRRINLSFTTTPSSARVFSNELVKPGNVVSGVVERVTLDAIVLDVTAQGHFKGTMSPQHLADHNGHAELMKSALRPGYEFDQLLVLDVEGSNLILSAKHSLVTSAQQLPLDVNQVHRNSVLHGYICNIIENGIFIRYLGRLTGFSPRNRATDDRRSSLSEVYQIGQSVRTNVVDVSSETSRITVSLKQSLCSSTDASFIQEYFLVEEKISQLQSVDSGGSDLRWVEQFNLGSTVKGKVHEIKDFGVVVSFQKYDDVFGFISHYQLSGTPMETGSSIRAAVLDVSKIERLVDLSLKPAIVNKSKKETTNSQAQKKRKREVLGELEVNQTVNAVVEIVKENYLVVSLPSYNNTLGYASRADYNTQNFPLKSFANGESVIATIMALPSPSTCGRLLLLLKSISEAMESSNSKRAKRKSSYNVGSLVQAEITEIRPLELRLKFGSSFHGRVHITEASDENYAEAPFSNFRFGQTLTARIISKISESVKRGYQWELSIKPSTLAGSTEIESVKKFSYSTGQLVSGFVYKVDNEWAWLTISRDVKAQLYILNSSSEPSELDEFQRRFSVGRAFSGYVLSCNKEKKLVRLISHPLLVDPERPVCQGDGPADHSSESKAFHIREGNVLGGRISKILPGVGGLLVQIDPHVYGKVHFTELADPGVADPLFGYHEGQFVKCEVLEIAHSGKGTVHIDLSLRSISHRTQKQKLSALNDTVNFPVLVERIEDLHPNTMVQAYVKNVTPKGCFIMLSRKVDAKVLLSNLSDGYVENPEKEFPVGKLVIGKVVSVEPLSKRVEVTLRTSSAVGAPKSDKDALSNLTVGDVISGRVKRVEPYGLFITVDHTNLVGLCHVSEISDNHVNDIDARHKAGDRVTAKILKVDKERHRISLGMKNSYFIDATTVKMDTRSNSGYAVNGDALSIGIASTPSPERSYQGGEDLDGESVDGKDLFLAEVESRASIPPLEVPLDDTENLDMGGVVNQVSGDATDFDTSDDKNKKHAAKKAKRLREQEIRAAEERLLEKDIPRDEDEFEKLVRSSPNSSFVWIKYMAFVLSLADVEKARSIAERALRTINVREELEKLNVWVAYFNLENEYGNPPEEAVAKVFHRALQYCDPKKVHLALLGMYERTEQHKLTDELLNRMVKKFKHSCKVWLRRVQWLLKQNQDGVQSVVNRALLSLPPHKHINFITQTALLEFKCGVPDRGRSLFEKMLREYPKRTDLWSVYLDQEIRLGDADVIRALFERAITLSLPPKKMKFLFKKYLEYEKMLGDDERVEAVKMKAMEYVESSLA